jgi:Holliday junction resolvase
MKMTLAIHKEKTSSVARKIRELARQLEKQGWEVRADTRGRTAPSPIGESSPDIEAVKGCRRILIRVETPESLKTSEEYLKFLARYARSRDDTRFDLVVTIPRKSTIASTRKANDAEHAH